MRRFAALYRELDQSTGTLDKRAALAAYFRSAQPADAAWALRLLSGGKIGGAKARIASSGELREWIAQASGVSIVPGQIAVTRMLSLPWSSAITRVSDRTAPLVAA